MTYDLAWLSNPLARRCILVEALANVAGTETTFYLSDKGYVTGASDTPANTLYMPAIAGGVNVTESISLDGSASLSYGDIELYNLSGERDEWLNYIWKNRAASVYIGDLTWPRADFQLIFNGIISDLDSKSVDRINIKIVDKLQRLNTPVSEVKLGGGTENAFDILPLTFGEVFNVTPLLTNPALLEYQVHNGPIERIIEVRDNGVPLDAYTTSLSAGKFYLTAAPAGTITASVQGYKNPTYINTIAAIIQAIVLNYGKASTRFVSNDIDLTNLSAFEASHPQPVGIYLTDRTNVISVIQELAQSIGAMVVMSRLGKLQLLQINIPPTGTPTVITSTDIIESSLRIVERMEVKSSSKIGYCKNWTVQENLQTGIPDEHKKMLSNEYLIVTQSNNTTSTAYKLDEEPVQRNTLLLSSLDAGNESLRDIAINTSVRTVYGFDGFSQLMLLKLGDTITLTNPRFGLQAGKLGTVIKLEPDWINSTVYVEALCSVDILTADTTAPSAPGTLTAVAVTSTTARLDWTAATDNVGVTGYNIYISGVLYVFLGNILYYNAIGLTSSTAYSFTVKARDKSGNVGTASNTATMTTPADSVDFLVSDLSATADGSLTATIKNHGVIDYPGGDSAPLAAPVVWYKDDVFLNDSQLITPLAAGDSVVVTQSGSKTPIDNGTYTITATVNETGEYTGELNPNGVLSKSITIAETDITKPTAPSNLVGTIISSSRIDYTWNASIDDIGVTTYKVYVNTVFTSNTVNTSFNVISLTQSTQYSVYVTALDAAGNVSDPSNTVVLTTPAAIIDMAAIDAGIDETTGKYYGTYTNVGELSYLGTPAIYAYWFINNVWDAGLQITTNCTPGQIITINSTTNPTTQSSDWTLRFKIDGEDAISGSLTNNNFSRVISISSGDHTAPTVPTGLNGYSASTTQINVSWNSSTDNVDVAGYRLFDGATQIGGDLSSSTLSYSHTGLTAGSSHTYQVLAFDAAGNASVKSTGVTVVASSIVNGIYVAKTGNDTTGTGTPENPYLTIQKAANVATAGKTVFIRSGTYTEKVNCTNSGTSTAYIRYTADAGATVIVTSQGLVSNGEWVGTFNVVSRSYIEIDHLTIQNNPSFGIFLYTGNAALPMDSYIYVHDNNILNSGNSACVGYRADNVIFTRNYCDGMSSYPAIAPATGIQEGISFLNCTSCTCSYNIVKNCQMECIDFKGSQTNVYINNNDVSLVKGRLGIYVDAFGGAVTNVNIFNNVVHDQIAYASGFGESAITISGETGGSVTGIKIYNNLIYNWCASGIDINHFVQSGYSPGVFANIDIYNNTIDATNMLGGSQWGGAGIFISGTNSTTVNCRISNNIMSNVRTIGGYNNMYMFSGFSGTVSYNCFYTGSTFGSNFITSDPLYTNRAGKNFSLTGSSPCINAGLMTGAPTTDIIGSTRTGNPDIGCYEKV